MMNAFMGMRCFFLRPSVLYHILFVFFSWHSIARLWDVGALGSWAAMLGWLDGGMLGWRWSDGRMIGWRDSGMLGCWDDSMVGYSAPGILG